MRTIKREEYVSTGKYDFKGLIVVAAIGVAGLLLYSMCGERGGLEQQIEQVAYKQEASNEQVYIQKW